MPTSFIIPGTKNILLSTFCRGRRVINMANINNLFFIAGTKAILFLATFQMLVTAINVVVTAGTEPKTDRTPAIIGSDIKGSYSSSH